jgi:porin
MLQKKRPGRWLLALAIAASSSPLIPDPPCRGQEPVEGCTGKFPSGCDEFAVVGEGNAHDSSGDVCSSFRCSPGLCDRETLTGDWGGRRTALQQSGITFQGRSTHFGFGVEGGIQSPPPIPLLGLGDTFKYTGRGEYDLIFDLEKFGGLPKGALLIRGEHWYGEYGNVSLRTGAFPPAVFPAALPPVPEAAGELFMSNFLITQPLSKEFVVYGGKADVLGGLDQDDFAGGDGTTQFVNQALVANPAFLLGLPYSSFTAGVVLPREWGRLTTFVFDPQDRTRDFFEIDDLFSKGIIVGSELKWNTELLQRKGEMHVGGLWKHVDLTDLRFNEPPPGVYPEPVVPGFPTLPDSFTLYLGGDQYLVQFADDPSRGYGLFGRASISDGNPTPVRYFLSAGLGGYSPLGKSRGDKFGLGWYYLGASNEFGALPRAIFDPRDGTGVEIFYSLQATPWMAISPDVQYLKPEVSALAEDAFVYGLRLNAVF